nr:lipoprotein [Euzebyales bacterium]
MSRTMLVLLAAVAVLVLAGCSKQPPEVAVNDQVPAAERTEAA